MISLSWPHLLGEYSFKKNLPLLYGYPECCVENYLDVVVVSKDKPVKLSQRPQNGKLPQRFKMLKLYGLLIWFKVRSRWKEMGWISTLRLGCRQGRGRATLNPVVDGVYISVSDCHISLPCWWYCHQEQSWGLNKRPSETLANDIQLNISESHREQECLPQTDSAWHSAWEIAIGFIFLR